MFYSKMPFFKVAQKETEIVKKQPNLVTLDGGDQQTWVDNKDLKRDYAKNGTKH